MTWRNFHRIWFIRRLLPLSKVITRDIMTSIGWLEVSRHHDLHRMAGGWGNQAVGEWVPASSAY